MADLSHRVSRYRASGVSRFHMPGHKGNCPFLEDLAGARDITEISGMDWLYRPSGTLAQLEDDYGVLYGSQCAVSTQGSTLCIQTMLALLKPLKGRILAYRNAHAAFLNSCTLLDVQPIWGSLCYNSKTGLALPPTPAELETALQQHPDVRVVYLTSPDYYGQIADIKAIAKVAHAHRCLLVVDNAHGAHLKFLLQDLHPIVLGADLCCDSLHKTLPVLTGGALLHWQPGRFSKEEVKHKMSLFGSSSPSYLTLQSIDRAYFYLKTKARQDWTAVTVSRQSLFADSSIKNKLQSNVSHNVSTFSEGNCTPTERTKPNPTPKRPETSLFSYILPTEPSKLTLDAFFLGYTGTELFSHLQRHQIEAEYCDTRYVVLMLSPFLTSLDYKRLCQALDALPSKDPIAQRHAPIPIPTARLRMHDVISAPTTRCSVSDAVGKISAENLYLCPPGIPLLIAGEEICCAQANLLKKYSFSAINVLQ